MFADVVGLLADEKGNKFDNMSIRVEPLTKTISWMLDLSILEPARPSQQG